MLSINRQKNEFSIVNKTERKEVLAHRKSTLDAFRSKTTGLNRPQKAEPILENEVRKVSSNARLG